MSNMADAKKCDICGAYYDKDTAYDVGEYGLFIKQHFELSKLDLCSSCRDKLSNFVKSMKGKSDN